MAALVGMLAGRYHRSGLGWFVLAALLSPLIGFVALMAIGRSGKHCPRCAEIAQPNALICWHCGHEFTPEVATKASIELQKP